MLFPCAITTVWNYPGQVQHQFALTHSPVCLLMQYLLLQHILLLKDSHRGKKNNNFIYLYSSSDHTHEINHQEKKFAQVFKVKINLKMLVHRAPFYFRKITFHGMQILSKLLFLSLATHRSQCFVFSTCAYISIVQFG